MATQGKVNAVARRHQGLSCVLCGDSTAVEAREIKNEKLRCGICLSCIELQENRHYEAQYHRHRRQTERCYTLLSLTILIPVLLVGCMGLFVVDLVMN